jgi:hypothetical protein
VVPTLEELIRDRAAKGELVHLSLVFSPIDNKWHAVYAPAHAFGVENGTGADPVEALIAALLSVKSSKKKVTATVTEPKIDPNRGTTYSEKPAKPGKLDDWMTKL